MAFSGTKKYDYIEVVNRMVPEFYRESDYDRFGSEEDVSLAFLGKLLKAAIQNDLIFGEVSTLDLSAVSQYFVPEGATKVSPIKFQTKIMALYGKEFQQFPNKDSFKSWLSGTLYPDIPLNEPSGFHSLLSSVGFSAYEDLSATHEYLIDNLGMFYFMNASGLSGTSTNASAVAIDYLADSIYPGEVATVEKSVEALFKFFWDNRESSTFYNSFFPASHASGAADLSGNEYLSGTQMFSAIALQLRTWTDDRLKNSEFYKDSLSTLLTGTGTFPTRLRDAGPFQRFLKAVSLGVADINLILEEISDLLSIDECPERFLELLANNIGWQFLTGDINKWRAQLRNAVMLYKTKGTRTGLAAATKLIFPDGVFDASSIVEAWESYLPKLLYYLIKTESFVAKEGLEFSPKEDMFEGGWPGSITFNQLPPSTKNAKDTNYRFLVDGILEDFHNKFTGIVIHGKDFKQLPMWTCVGDPDDPTTQGFYHRGQMVKVPPWEKYGFYKECEINTQRLDYFCEVLSGDRGQFGFEVAEDLVSAFRTLVQTAINSAYELADVPQYSENNKFRFFTSGHELPPNYSSFVEYGYASALQDFDTWNTKGSHLFAAFAASTLDYTVDGYDSFKNKAALKTYHDILKQTVPLHAVIRIVLYLDLEDEYDPPAQTLCVQADYCLDDFNTEYLNSRRTNFWAGGSGTGDLGTTFVNGDGRVLPSLGADFWQVSATDLDRNASRRRDYRYALGCFPYVRGGKAAPVALNFYKLSLPTSDPDANPYANTAEYIIKGFDYDYHLFEPPSSVVWEPSGFYSYSADGCELTGLSSGDFDLSTLFPFRAVPETDFECSSVVIYRDTLKGINEVIISHLIKQDKFADLSDENIRAFEFGDSVHASYEIYQNEFSGSLKNTLSPNVPYYGGHNFLSYSFGPTIWNSDFRYRGGVLSATTGTSIPGKPSLYRYGYDVQWSSVVGGTKAAGQKYQNFKNNTITLGDRTYFAGAPNTLADENVGVNRTRRVLKTREILSSIEIHQVEGDSESFLVVNDSDTSNTYNSVLRNSITLYNVDGNPLQICPVFRSEDAGDPHYNKLRPQSQFFLDVYAKSVGKTPQRIKVQLETSGLTDDAGNETVWVFDWVLQRWVRSAEVEEGRNVAYLDVPGDEYCVKPYRILFHTEEQFTDKSLPCSNPFMSSDVHTSSTNYILRVSSGNISEKNGRGVFVTGLTIYDISVTDRVLNHSMNDFNESEVDTIYSFWDELHGKHSRDAADSSGYFETSGGSRAEYVELLGDGAYTTSSASFSGLATYAVVEYEVED
jgi:hypothetical protein